MSITSPAANATFTAPASIALAASAQDSDGTVTQVQYFANASPIGTATTSPYSFNWTNVAAGTYSLTAVATDNAGATTTSAPVPITVGAAQAKLYFIHTDHLNTPRLIADDQQRTVWRWDNTDPFGGNPPDENPSGLGTFEFPLRFPGQYFDRETATLYNWRRTLDPALGRYLQVDPLGLVTGRVPTPTTILNQPYAYVESDPLSFVDPTGERRLRRYVLTDEFKQNLPDFLVEQGAKAATTPEGFGEAVGKYLCKATGGRVQSAFDACSINGCDRLLAAGSDAFADCVKACRDQIRKTCNPQCPQ